MDFTIKQYSKLLKSLKAQDYNFQTFNEFIKDPKDRVVILRHDIDKLPKNALKFAVLESKHEIKASYYFRIGKQSNNPEMIKSVADLGHEIGYHYEDLNSAKGNKQIAIDQFSKNLKYFRQFYPVNTGCMHGNPLGKWDNRHLWDDYNYQDFGIIGEPYFDIEYDKVFYITDTGRKWNNSDSNLRDRVNSRYNYTIKNTNMLIRLIEQGKLPDQILINTHPQRWFNPGYRWVRELILQNIKNQVKKVLNQVRK